MLVAVPLSSFSRCLLFFFCFGIIFFVQFCFSVSVGFLCLCSEGFVMNEVVFYVFPFVVGFVRWWRHLCLSGEMFVE